MQGEIARCGDEIKPLQRCINDLVSVLALSALWIGGEPAHILRTSLDALLSMLRLDLIFARLIVPIGAAPIEMIRVSESRKRVPRQDLRQLIGGWLAAAHADSASLTLPLEEGDISIVRLRLGLQGELGVIVAGSQQAGFPNQIERLILGVAANQVAIGLQEARLLSEQRRLANELDHRVALRTAELAAANDELKRSEALLAEAQRLSSTGSFSWRVARDEIAWSEELHRIFQFERDAPVTIERIASRVHSDDLPLFWEKLNKARGDSGDFELAHRLQMPDGSIRYLHLVAHGIRDSGGQIEFLGAIQDVTERRLSEQALDKARSELAHVARASSLGVLAASIAHEINQPLSGIVTNAGTGLRMLAGDPPNVEGARETVRRTIRDGNRAADVIARLRALFSEKTAAAESMDLNEATREVIALTLSDLQSRRVILRTDFAEALPPISGDRVQLQQVVLNLLMNASDAMSSIEDRPRELLIRTGRDPTDCVCLTVKDSGVGFDSSNADKIFQPFYTTKPNGMGIGLSVSRSIIESHRGRIWVERNEGPGAAFSFSIPCTGT